MPVFWIPRTCNDTWQPFHLLNVRGFFILFCFCFWSSRTMLYTLHTQSQNVCRVSSSMGARSPRQKNSLSQTLPQWGHNQRTQASLWQTQKTGSSRSHSRNPVSKGGWHKKAFSDAVAESLWYLSPRPQTSYTSDTAGLKWLQSQVIAILGFCSHFPPPLNPRALGNFWRHLRPLQLEGATGIKWRPRMVLHVGVAVHRTDPLKNVDSTEVPKRSKNNFCCLPLRSLPLPL